MPVKIVDQSMLIVSYFTGKKATHLISQNHPIHKVRYSEYNRMTPTAAQAQGALGLASPANGLEPWMRTARTRRQITTTTYSVLKQVFWESMKEYHIC